MVKFPQAALEDASNPALIHARSCPACRNLLMLDKLTSAIIKASRASSNEVERAASNPFLINSIRNRIQELREQRFGSWEMAVTAMRGWLVAFATVAIILIAVSVQWQPSAITSDLDDDLNTQSTAEYLVSDVPSEDDPYAHK
ncbi:MAG: hypothetical protein ACRD2L_18245 [Terriglobia bacterium]